MIEKDIVIIGGGPAGLSAATVCTGDGLDVLLIERNNSLGGILNQCIHNGFGLHEFKEELTGPEYAERFIDQVRELDIDIMISTMVINVTNDKVVTAINSDGVHHIKAKSIIYAMGCRERTGGAINLMGYRPAGVYMAGSAQKLINIQNRKVGTKAIIYGSGDIGLIMARRLTFEGIEVKAVVELNKESSGLKRNIAQCLNDYDIPLLLHHKIVKVHGKDRVSGIDIEDLDTGEVKFYDCDTLLLSVGLIPENDIVSDGVEISSTTKGPVVNNNRETSVDGVFSCGNVLHVHDIVDFVSEEARIAGKSAKLYAKGRLDRVDSVTINTDENLLYALPQKLLKNKKVDIYFRAKKSMKDVILRISDKDGVIVEKKIISIIPSEMEKVSVEVGDNDLFMELI